jgi:hypothetical protein
MTETTGERIAENEVRVRDVNELIAEKTADLANEGLAPDEDRTEFLCACGSPGCAATISLTRTEFDAAHGADDQFVVFPGHDTPEIEDVVERHQHYLIVRKKPGYTPDDVT